MKKDEHKNAGKDERHSSTDGLVFRDTFISVYLHTITFDWKDILLMAHAIIMEN